MDSESTPRKAKHKEAPQLVQNRRRSHSRFCADRGDGFDLGPGLCSLPAQAQQGPEDPRAWRATVRYSQGEGEGVGVRGWGGGQGRVGSQCFQSPPFSGLLLGNIFFYMFLLIVV